MWSHTNVGNCTDAQTWNKQKALIRLNSRTSSHTSAHALPACSNVPGVIIESLTPPVLTGKWCWIAAQLDFNVGFFHLSNFNEFSPPLEAKWWKWGSLKWWSKNPPALMLAGVSPSRVSQWPLVLPLVMEYELERGRSPCSYGRWFGSLEIRGNEWKPFHSWLTCLQLLAVGHRSSRVEIRKCLRLEVNLGPF